MKLPKWLNRIQKIKDGLVKQGGFRAGKYILMMSQKEYDELMLKAKMAMKPKEEPKFMHIHGILIASVPTIGKRKWQCLTTEKYVQWVRKYTKAGRFSTGKSELGPKGATV